MTMSYTINSRLRVNSGGMCTVVVASETITVYGAATFYDKAREFQDVITFALRPARFRLRKGPPRDFEAVLSVKGCSTEFEVRTKGRNWIVTDDNGKEHSSMSLQKALESGVMSMRLK